MAMSKLRPTLPNAAPGTPCPRNGTAYLMILVAVEQHDGLIHGKLDNRHGEFCAIGDFFDTNPKQALPTDLIDEVAAVNDSVPTYTRKQRKQYVAKWLRWKLTQLGMPGYRTTKTPEQK